MNSLLSAPLMVESSTRRVFSANPLLPMDAPWQVAVFAALLLALVGFIGWLYCRDSRELPAAVGIAALILRLVALAALVLFFFQPQLQDEVLLTKPSRVVVLIDTSLSMGLRDDATPDSPKRIDRITASLREGQWLTDLAEKHDVSIYRFDESAHPVPLEQIERTTIQSKPDNLLTESDGSVPPGWAVATRWIGSGLMLAAFGLTLLAVPFARVRLAEKWKAWLVLGFAGCAAASLMLVAASDLASPQLIPARDGNMHKMRDSLADGDELESSSSATDLAVDWIDNLHPQGTSTRIGQAVGQIVTKERGGPIAGIVIITDGGQNGGLDLDRAIAAAQSANIPLYLIGVGSPETPRNAAILELRTPPSVFPGDKFKVNGIVQANGMKGESIRMRLSKSDVSGGDGESLEDEIAIQVESDGAQMPVEFEIAAEELGKHTYVMRAVVDSGDADLRDNERSCSIDVVDRETVVLLIAGGPMRDFHFLRNQLYRDDEIKSYVWLQSAVEGADQEADKLVFDFPSTREELDEIDCIVAFDPDWRRLTPEQSLLFEQWVAEQAGGLISIAGPVNTPEWTRVPRGDAVIDPIRGLYPVSFYNQGSAVLKLGRFGSERPFPLEFTREGTACEFLVLGRDANESAENWRRFEGVYGYYAVNEPKSAADVLAYFSDPTTAIDGRLPIYLATQFYGAGRVAFQASGEVYRLRTVQVEFFQQYYSKLIRWASQGRLLRESDRGLLLCERQKYWLGDQVVVKAVLRDVQNRPLLASVVEASFNGPNGASGTIKLQCQADSPRGEQFSGAFVVTEEGDYRIHLPVPDGTPGSVLTAQISVSIPDLEKQNPQRNDKLMSEMAEQTGGRFYTSIEDAIRATNTTVSLAQSIVPQDQQSYLPGIPDADFHRRLMIWMMIVASSCLCLEWIVRRLHKLA